MDPNTIPNTAAYLYLGLVAIVTIAGLFIASLVIRVTRLRSELKMIERADQES